MFALICLSVRQRIASLHGRLSVHLARNWTALLQCCTFNPTERLFRIDTVATERKQPAVELIGKDGWAPTAAPHSAPMCQSKQN